MGEGLFDEVHKFLEQALAALTLAEKEEDEKCSFAKRELALFRTKIEEGSLWLYQAENKAETGYVDKHKAD